MKTKIRYTRDGMTYEGWTYALPFLITYLSNSRDIDKRMRLITVFRDGENGSMILKVPACMIELIG